MVSPRAQNPMQAKEPQGKPLLLCHSKDKLPALQLMRPEAGQTLLTNLGPP